MQAVFNGFAKPNRLMLFARKSSRDFMMRSEKRGGYNYNGSNGKPPKRRRKRAGFIYIALSMLLSVLLWPVGMIMLWRRKVRLSLGTKLLSSILTLFLCVTLIGITLTVPTENEGFTRVQDSVNDFLDYSVKTIAKGYNTVLDKSVVVYQDTTTFIKALADAGRPVLADGIDKGIDLTGNMKEQVVAAFKPAPSAEPSGSVTPENSATPASQTPAGKQTPDGSEKPTPETSPSVPPSDATAALTATSAQTAKPSGAPATQPAATATDAPSDSPSASPKSETSQTPSVALTIYIPQTTPDPSTAVTLGDGKLGTDRKFVSATPSPEPTQKPTPKPELTDERIEETPSASSATATATPAPTPEVTATVEPTATPTPTPEPTPTPVPTPTPEPTPVPTLNPALQPKPAGEMVVYFFDGSAGYHTNSSCNSMKNAPARTLAEAVEKGKRCCRGCNPPAPELLDEPYVVWVDKNNTFHLTDECADFEGKASLKTFADAVADGCTPCATCQADEFMDALKYTLPVQATEEPEPTVEPTATPTVAPTAEPTATPTVEPTPELTATSTPAPQAITPAFPLRPAGEALLYHTTSGGWYHTVSNCSKMSGADLYPFSECVADKFKRCRKCNAPEPELLNEHCLWMDEESLCHTTDACPSFEGKWTLIARDAALEGGSKGCTICGASEYLLPNTVINYPAE